MGTVFFFFLTQVHPGVSSHFQNAFPKLDMGCYNILQVQACSHPNGGGSLYNRPKSLVNISCEEQHCKIAWSK